MKKIYLLAATCSILINVRARSDHTVAQLCFAIQKKVTFIRDGAQVATLSAAEIDALHSVNRQLQKLQYKIYKQLQKK